MLFIVMCRLFVFIFLVSVFCAVKKKSLFLVGPIAIFDGVWSQFVIMFDDDVDQIEKMSDGSYTEVDDDSDDHISSVLKKVRHYT